MYTNLSAEVNIMSCLNFAMQQNYIPLIKSITVKNDGDETLTDIYVRIFFEPEFARVYTSHIEKIEPGRPVEISPVNILVSPEYMFSLSESMAAVAGIELYSVNDDGTEEQLWYESMPVDLMPYDFWTGNILPEMTAAQVADGMDGVISQLLCRSCRMESEGRKNFCFRNRGTILRQCGENHGGED